MLEVKVSAEGGGYHKIREFLGFPHSQRLDSTFKEHPNVSQLLSLVHCSSGLQIAKPEGRCSLPKHTIDFHPLGIIPEVKSEPQMRNPSSCQNM